MSAKKTKTITSKDLPTIRQRYKDQKIVMALGTYDLLHVGHLEFLTWCKGLGDVLVVAINNDLKVRHVKGKNRPVISENDRLRMIDALSLVDYSILAPWKGGDTEACFIEFAQKLQPDVVCLSPEAKNVISVWQQSLPKAIVAIDPQQKNRSTTSIIERVLNNYAKDE